MAYSDDTNNTGFQPISDVPRELGFFPFLEQTSAAEEVESCLVSVPALELLEARETNARAYSLREHMGYIRRHDFAATRLVRTGAAGYE